MPDTPSGAAKIPILEQRLGTLETRVSELADETAKGFAQVERQITDGIKDLTKSMNEGLARQEGRKRGTIGILATAGVGAVGMAGTLLWTLLLSQINNVVNPLRADLTWVTADLASLRNDYRDTSSKLSELREKFTAAEAQRLSTEREIETQFNALTQQLNMIYADEERTNSVMWNALSLQGAKMPPYPERPHYFPTVSGKGMAE